MHQTLPVKKIRDTGNTLIIPVTITSYSLLLLLLLLL